MIEKAVIIDACCQCRHRYRIPGDTRLRCSLTERDTDLVVIDLEIPNWCPLPDADLEIVSNGGNDE